MATATRAVETHRADRVETPEEPDGSAVPGAGGSASFDALLAQYGALVTWAVTRAAGGLGRHEIDDIRQDVHTALWRQVASGRAISYPSAYVYRAAVRETVRALHRLRRRQGEPLSDAHEAPTSEPGPLAQLLAHEQRESVESAIRALPVDRRRAVQGHMAGFSVQELMDLYGWSYQRARNLVARGLADVRNAVARR